MSPSLRRLLIGVLLGLTAGLIYGWLLRPVRYVDTAPDSLRADYRTDYVLMVAEAYRGDGDLDLAQVRLAALGPLAGESYVAEALEYAVANDFSRTDLDTLNHLAVALRALPAPAEIGGP